MDESPVRFERNAPSVPGPSRRDFASGRSSRHAQPLPVCPAHFPVLLAKRPRRATVRCQATTSLEPLVREFGGRAGDSVNRLEKIAILSNPRYSLTI
jgi:hypothetical protein